MKKEGFAKIYSTLNLTEAHTVRFLLENNGINAVIENVEMNPFFGMVAARDAEAQVWVPEEQSGEAEALLAQATQVDLEHLNLRKCRQCGVMVCDLYDYCWNCMASMKTGKVEREESPGREPEQKGRFPALYILFIIILTLLLIGFISRILMRS